MGRIDVDLFYLDAVVTSDKTVEELDEELNRMKEESEKMTDWPMC